MELAEVDTEGVIQGVVADGYNVRQQSLTSMKRPSETNLVLNSWINIHKAQVRCNCSNFLVATEDTVRPIICFLVKSKKRGGIKQIMFGQANVCSQPDNPRDFVACHTELTT